MKLMILGHWNCRFKEEEEEDVNEGKRTVGWNINMFREKGTHSYVYIYIYMKCKI